MKSFTTTAIFLASAATSALAQNTTLPFAACMLPCDTAALKQVGCSASDIPCHCEKAPETFAILVPCVLNNSTCGEEKYEDLVAFGQFASDSCAAINATSTDITAYFPVDNNVNCTYYDASNSTSSNSSASSNTTVAPAPSVSVYQGSAAKLTQGGIFAALVGVAGLAFAL